MPKTNEPSKQTFPQQNEMPFAVVQGKAMSVLPNDLYIPPDALEVILEAFEGPLDLLLYLIRRQNLDILDIDVAAITHQYMGYIQLMRELKLELAADYLVMAAMLAETKARMLLPRQLMENEDQEDPRLELIRRLQEYGSFKQAAVDIDKLSRMGRDIYQASADSVGRDFSKSYPELDMKDLLIAFEGVLRRAETLESHQIHLEKLSVRERMSRILDRLGGKSFVRFEDLFSPHEGKAGIVVTFLAMMELIKDSLVDVVQARPFGSIHLTARSS